jgi:protein TonB
LLSAVAGHAALAAIALNWMPANSASSTAPPVITIDLIPLGSPPVPEKQVAPGPEAADSGPQSESEQPDKVVKTEPHLPKLPEKTDAVAMLPPPMPETLPEERPTPRDTRHQAEKGEHKKERKVASRAAAPATFEAQRSPAATAPAAGAARVPAIAVASWKSDLMARLNRYKRYPPGTDRRGTATVAFSVNRMGEVTSSRLVHSSGDAALDQEAVTLPRRASPLPRPPEGMASAPIALTVPVHFGGN